MSCSWCTCKLKTKRERKDELRRIVEDNIWGWDVYQSKPYTCVYIIVNWLGVDKSASGFSKVRWPDEWDEDYGIQIAYDKAVAQIVKELLDEGVSAPCCG